MCFSGINSEHQNGNNTTSDPYSAPSLQKLGIPTRRRYRRYDLTCSTTSHSILSTGAWKTWCMATVNSTTPKLALKDFLVFDIIDDNSERISSDNCFSSCTDRFVVSKEAVKLSITIKAKYVNASKLTLRDKFFRWIGFSTESRMGVETSSEKNSPLSGREHFGHTISCITKKEKKKQILTAYVGVDNINILSF